MNKIVIIVALLFLSILSIGFTLKKVEEEKPNVYKTGNLTWTFYEYGECGCNDSCFFTETSKNYFVFSDATHFQESGYFKLKYSLPCDSMQVFQRVEYAYGVLYSETEGVIIYDSTRLKKKKQEKYVSYGGWILRSRKGHDKLKFDIKREWEGKRVMGVEAPTVIRKIAEDSLMKWRKKDVSNPEEVEKYIKENNGLGLFVNGIEVEIKFYLSGRLTRKTFYFPFLHGEC